MTVRRELRGLLADHLRSWAVTLQGWAWRLDPDEARTGPLVAAHEDAERAVAAREEASAAYAPLLMHVCEPLDGTRTLCGMAAGSVAAIDFAARNHARGPFCQPCVGRLRASMVEVASDLEHREGGDPAKRPPGLPPRP